MARKTINGTDYVLVSDVADYCSVGRSTVRRWVQSGKLKAWRLPGGRYRVSARDFVDFLIQWRLPVPVQLRDLVPPRE